MRTIARTLAGLTAAAAMGLLLASLAVNWVTGCESWDREQWTEAHSCVTPADLLGAFVGSAQARELTVRERQRDVAERVSPSWEVRLDRIERDRRREEARDRAKSDREWRRLTRTPSERHLVDDEEEAE